MPPPILRCPNVAFEEPYAHLPQRQQSVATIGGYAARNVTPGFKGKSECIEHMCARIKFHTCVDSVYTKTQCKSVKRVLKLYYMTECLKNVT
jgi:hypothetical protein